MTFARQFKALTKKNFILRIRHPYHAIVEVVFPLAIFYLFIWMRGKLQDPGREDQFIHVSAVPLPSFKQLISNDVLATRMDTLKCVSFDSGFDERFYIRFFPFVNNLDYFETPMSPLLFCNDELCSANNQNASQFCTIRDIVVAPYSEDSPASSKTAVTDFSNFLATTQITSDHASLVLQATSNAAINDVMKSSSYDHPGQHPYGIGIIFHSGYPDYDFTIRLNDTVGGHSEDQGQPLTMPDTKRNLAPPSQSEWDVAYDHCDYHGANGDYIGCNGAYLDSGELTVQRLVSDWIVNTTITAKRKTTTINSGCQNSKYNDAFGKNCENFPLASYADVFLSVFPTASYANDGFWKR